MGISIIIPTYNEAGNIEHLIKSIYDVLSKEKISYEIFVMDDNSPDGTAKIVNGQSPKYKAKAIIRKKNKGLSPAVIDGFWIAKSDIILVMDGDLQHPPSTIPKLYNAIKNGADIAISTRRKEEESISSWPFYRKTISFFAGFLTRPLTKAADPMSGFFAIKKDVIKGKKLSANGYKILLEILVKGRYKKIKEVPFNFGIRTKGKSKLSVRIIIEYVFQLFGLYFYKFLR